MTYDEALRYIHSVSWKGSIPGLDRIGELCGRLGNLQKSLRFIHVAGTNGKGSVSKMLASVLTAAGFRTGLFTSPYLVDFCERMSVDGVNISCGELCESVARVRPAADAMAESPTEFELITAIAFDYFYHAGCDIVVLECGMGGRLDSTNVIGVPEAAVITNIALDHTSFLGDTEEKIAAEKAGIIKKPQDGRVSHAVLGKASASARRVIAEKCRECGAVLHGADEEIALDSVTLSREGIGFVYCGQRLFLPMCGLYQETNVRTALCTVEVLRSRGFEIPDGALEKGLAAARWRGRFETLCRSPYIIFDGAHNPDGAAYTASTFRALWQGERAVLVSGVMADKDSTRMAGSFAGFASQAFTFRPNNPRAMDAEAYADVLRRAGIAACPCGSAEDAVSRAVCEAKKRGCPILCAGSLYMYAEILSAVQKVCGL